VYHLSCACAVAWEINPLVASQVWGESAVRLCLHGLHTPLTTPQNLFTFHSSTDTSPQLCVPSPLDTQTRDTYARWRILYSLHHLHTPEQLVWGRAVLKATMDCFSSPSLRPSRPPYHSLSYEHIHHLRHAMLLVVCSRFVVEENAPEMEKVTWVWEWGGKEGERKGK
jgi:hypothetical protein